MKNIVRRIKALFMLIPFIFCLCGCANKTVASKADVSNLDCLIDLHLHLDGAISLESAKKLARLQNIPIPKEDSEIKSLFVVPENCQNLNDFLKAFDFPCSLIQTKEGLTMAVHNLLEELYNQGIIYVEIKFAPQKSTDKGLSQEEAVIAAIEGLKNSKIDANLILGCMRGDNNHDENMETLRLAKKYLGKGVCALDLAGAEALYPTENFKDIFSLARKQNIPFTIHAGEAAGPESVNFALDFGASRIGHGVRSIEDQKTVERLARSKIPIDLCPTSNLDTCIFKNISEYPLRKYLDAGVIVTINTDDPAIENTSLKKEWQILIDEFKITRDELKSLLLNSANASYASDEIKLKLIRKINERLG